MALNQQCFEEIKSWGFEGFLPVSTLKTTLELTNYLDTVPHQSGVYLVLNPTLEKPNWLRKSVGGHFKGEDPTVASIFLEKNWVNGAKILYVGETQRTLEKRVSELIQFGSGKLIGHKGGRILWQLENHNDLLICWLVHENPVEMRKEILRKFKSKYNVLPFANLKG